MYNTQGGGKHNDGIISLESDEQALAHITAHAGNLPSAQFGALAIAGCGREMSRRQRDAKSFAASGSAPMTNTLDYRDQPAVKEIYGAYEVFTGKNRLLSRRCEFSYNYTWTMINQQIYTRTQKS